MSNFLFLQTHFPDLYAEARRVETNLRGDPRSACFYARRALEAGVGWMYDNDLKSLPEPFGTVGQNIGEPAFKELVGRALFQKIKLIQRAANAAVHERAQVNQVEAWGIARELFHFLFWLARTYAVEGKPADGLVWNDALVPPSPAQIVARTQAQLRLELERAKAIVLAPRVEDEIKSAQIELAKTVAAQTPDQHDYSEAATRDLFIDVLLKEAGWPLDQKRDREYEVAGMPTDSGIGRVDYVLWGDDGLPLALVEAKRARKSASEGRQQAALYADCLEHKFGRRPVVFYSNGYETWLWDEGNGYPPRAVQGFYSKAELERLIGQRPSPGASRHPLPQVGEESGKKALASVEINTRIAGGKHAYQTRAIRAFGEHLEARHRKGLLVMATGTGKTRTTIALVDVLMRAGWAKRVLFLADRTALVRQAMRAFKEHLPDSSPQNLVEDKSDSGARVVCSTYPTLMNAIEGKSEEGARRFGVGHFDLIVVDEAHRGVYQKYRAIFEYFDSLLLGLTATPRDEVDKDTYALFDLKKGAPTSFYELDEAVRDGFLVPAKMFAGHLKFPREGIKYAQLSDEDKAQWDEREWGEDGAPDEIAPGAVNAWLFNADTVDKVLETLMTRGLKVQGGAKLGKTIIFARNHEHAMFIQKRFDLAYPHLAGHFARVIDNYESKSQTLIDDFSGKEQPTIAISVDMLDTGINVPEITNLVFFKPVRSKTKFAQMVGRGTRLCPDLLEVGKPKREFYVFDFCGNIEYFEAKPEGVEAPSQVGLDQKIFERRVEMLRLTSQNAGEELCDLRCEWADTLHEEVTNMNRDNFVVRPHLRAVERWEDRTRWNSISDTDADEIVAHLAALPTELPSDEPLARGFDLTCLRLQLALLHSSKEWPKLQKTVRELAQNLSEKTSIPFVKAQEPLLLELLGDEWWENTTLLSLETLRKSLRDLVQFADKGARPMVFSDFEDSDVRLIEHAGAASSTLPDYQKRVRAFIESRRLHPAIRKLHQNEPLSASEWAELDDMVFHASGFENRADFEAYFGAQPPLGALVRSVVGLDREAAKRAFGTFLNGSNLGSAQIDFINQIIDLLAQNGRVEPKQLFDQPFTIAHPSGAAGLFPLGLAQLVGVLENINAGAMASH